MSEADISRRLPHVSKAVDTMPAAPAAPVPTKPAAWGPRPARDVRHLGDFTATPRLVLITALALPIGAVSAVVAWALLKLIGLITNAVFYQRVDTSLVAPGAVHHTPCSCCSRRWSAASSSALMARYGSEKIRGHGMPEAIEAILIGGSKIAAAGRGPQAGLVGDRHRHRRPVRRRGPDHHDRRRHRLALRAAPAAHRRRAQDPAGRRRRRPAWPPPSTRRSPRCCSRWSCCCSSGDRAASSRSPPRSSVATVVRAAAARHRRALPGARARCTWPARRTTCASSPGWSPARSRSSRPASSTPPRTRFRQAADPLDVVAGDRRTGHRRRRPVRARRRSAWATT